MYRNNKISIGAKSEESSSNESNDASNQETVSFTENGRDSLNTSISEMLKKMSIKDKKSTILLDIINDGDFMTSSPIRRKPAHKKSIVELDECADKENEIPLEFTDNIKKSHETNSHEYEENLVRAVTVRYQNKPVVIKSNIKEQPKNVVNKSLTRSNSCYRSNAFLSVAAKKTVPQPFSFEKRDKELLANRIKVVEDGLLEIKRIASSFRANPMPISSPRLPEKLVAKTTNQVPFKFESEQRINYYQEKNSMKSLETSSMTSLANISAAKTYDLSYLRKLPFKPKPSSQYVTFPETPNFSLKQRSQQRNEFNEHIRQKDLMLAKEKEDREKERIEKEKMEYQQFRSQTIVKAAPIRHYKTVDIVHEKKTTKPTSPKFSDRSKK